MSMVGNQYQNIAPNLPGAGDTAAEPGWAFESIKARHHHVESKKEGNFVGDVHVQNFIYYHDILANLSQI